VSPSNATKHFVRINGKILGPFDMNQLRSLKSRGRLRIEHEVSSDRRTWIPASDLADLFEESTARKSMFGSEAATELDQPIRSIEWFYAVGEQQQGPVTFQHLKKMASQGTLTEKDLIWHSGLDEWIPAGDQPGLISETKFRPKAARNRHGSTEALADSQTFLWSALLQQFRDLITVTQLKRSLHMLASIGGGSMLATIVLIFIFFLMLAIKTNTFRPALLGAGLILLTSALRFVAMHSLHAGEQLIFNTPQQFNSLSFLKAIAVLLLTAGVLFSSLLLVTSVQVTHTAEKIPLVMGASGLLFVYVAGAIFILQPEGMNISIVPGSHAGREGIAILSFLLKLQVRQSSFLFAACAVLACASFGWAAYLLAVDREQPLLADGILLDPTLLSLIAFGLMSILAGGLVPLCAYLALAVGSILPEVCESIFRMTSSTAANQSARSVSENVDA